MLQNGSMPHPQRVPPDYQSIERQVFSHLTLKDFTHQPGGTHWPGGLGLHYAGIVWLVMACDVDRGYLVINSGGFEGSYCICASQAWGVDLQDTIRLITLTQTCYENAYNPKGATGKSEGISLRQIMFVRCRDRAWEKRAMKKHDLVETKQALSLSFVVA